MPNAKVFDRDVHDGRLTVILSVDAGDWHMSISHKWPGGNPGRYPSWDEIFQARYTFCPDDVTMVMMLPPKEEYVNMHETTFHLWELHSTPVEIKLPNTQ